MTLYDSTELARTGTRKFHTAWAELGGAKVLIPPTVGLELAPDGRPGDGGNGVSDAERRLAAGGAATVPGDTLKYLERQAWWSMMWRSPDSPYRLIRLTDEQRALTERLTRAIPADCFPGAARGHIREHRDTRIICETLAVGGRMLLTSNMRTIDHRRVNHWTVRNGQRLGFPARPVLFKADETLALALATDEGLERGMRVAVLAAWTLQRRTAAQAVADGIDGLRRMARGTGGHLRLTAKLIETALVEHPDHERLVTAVRRGLPSPAVESDRAHPTHPERPTARTYGRTHPGTAWTPDGGQ